MDALPNLMSQPQTRLPAERRRMRALQLAKQSLIVATACALLVWFGLAVRAGLARNGISFDMGFLSQAANFDISEGYVFTWQGLRHISSSDTNAAALLAGFVNTIKTALLAIVLTTVFGTLVGMARLSQNWLVRQLSFGFVELIRNTPMLIQLVFWYFAVALKLPALSDASVWLGGVVASQQGLYLPGIGIAAGASAGSMVALLLVVTCGVGSFAVKSARVGLIAAAAAALLLTILMGFPLALEVPHQEGFEVVGGWSWSPEFSALLVGLTVYTSAFIAEIVRGAIQSLPRGQWEAAAALGLSRNWALREVVIPQAFRIVLPAFGNQYISLAKSTSLGIAIGFPDLFNIYGTVANTSGRSLEGMLIVMLAYLFLSWVISAVVNLLNAWMLRAGGTR